MRRERNGYKRKVVKGETGEMKDGGRTSAGKQIIFVCQTRPRNKVDANVVKVVKSQQVRMKRPKEPERER